MIGHLVARVRQEQADDRREQADDRREDFRDFLRRQRHRIRQRLSERRHGSNDELIADTGLAVDDYEFEKRGRV